MNNDFKNSKPPIRKWNVSNIQISEWETEKENFTTFSIQKSFKHQEKWVNEQIANLTYYELDKLLITLQKVKNDYYNKKERGDK